MIWLAIAAAVALIVVLLAFRRPRRAPAGQTDREVANNLAPYVPHRHDERDQ